MWDQKWEAMSSDEMQAWQLDKLRETVAWVSARVPFYRSKFAALNLCADDIRELSDLARFSFTIKTDLRDTYPVGMYAVPMKDIVRIHASSGTTGKPITGAYTAEDMSHWAECSARCLTAWGVTAQDLCQISYGYGLFTGGLGIHAGAERLGAAVLPASSGMTERQITLMRDFKVNALFCTPSYALTMVDKATELGVDIRELPLRVGGFGAEPWSLEMKREIEARMGIKAHNVYGLTEMMGPCLSFSCEAEDGYMHINEDHFIAEIIDPATEEVLPLGEQGELVLTAIQRRAMPLIRYRTRDITSLKREKCACGRTLVKMGRIYGRSDDMMIINGVNVFPNQVESILLDVPEVEPQYVLIIRKKGRLDALSVDVEAKPSVYEQGEEVLVGLEKKISDKIRGVIGIGIEVHLVAPRSLTRSEGKARRIFDARQRS